MKAPKLVKTKKSQLKVPVTTAGRKMQFYRNSNRSGWLIFLHFDQSPKWYKIVDLMIIVLRAQTYLEVPQKYIAYVVESPLSYSWYDVNNSDYITLCVVSSGSALHRYL